MESVMNVSGHRPFPKEGKDRAPGYRVGHPQGFLRYADFAALRTAAVKIIWVSLPNAYALG